MTEENIVIGMEDAQSDFVRIADIDGRNVVVFPLKIDKAQGDEEYPFLEADVIVLDGDPTELMDTIPFVVSKMRLSSSPMIRNGERMLEKANRANAAFAAPYAGVINSRKGQKGGRAYGVEAWAADSPIRTLANEQAALYIKGRSVVDDASAFK
jgi:hypothetical protein